MGGEGVGELRFVGLDLGLMVWDVFVGGEDVVVGVGKGLGGFEKVCVDGEMVYEIGYVVCFFECYYGGFVVVFLI